MIRGPGVPAGAQPQQMVVNADLAPTILDATRAVAGRVQDGRSLLPLTRDPALGSSRPVLVEIAKGAGMLTTAIRTRRWLYAEHASGATELYDIAADPHQLRSLHANPALAAIRARLARQLAGLRTCAGIPAVGRSPSPLAARTAPQVTGTPAVPVGTRHRRALSAATTVDSNLPDG